MVFISATAYGMQDSQKHSLKCTMVHLYDELPEEAESIAEMFSEGIFYGRLRFNTFGLKWEEEIDNERENYAIGAVGGSMIWKSATMNGFGMGAGAYMTQGFGTLDSEDVSIKQGKGY